MRQASYSEHHPTRQVTARRLEDVIGDIFRRHRYLAAATQELAAFLDEEIEQRAQDRIAELRGQLERGGS